MMRFMAFHAGSTDSNSVRGTHETPANRRCAGSSNANRAHVSPTFQPVIRLSTALAILLFVVALAWLTGPEAHAASTYQRRVAVVKKVWGERYYREALRVAVCESGLNPRARNGQFLGAWQMGRRERSRFGHGPGVSHQARAAYRYWRLAGWKPWECQP